MNEMTAFTNGDVAYLISLYVAHNAQDGKGFIVCPCKQCEWMRRLIVDNDNRANLEEIRKYFEEGGTVGELTKALDEP